MLCRGDRSTEAVVTSLFNGLIIGCREVCVEDL